MDVAPIGHVYVARLERVALDPSDRIHTRPLDVRAEASFTALTLSACALSG